MSSITRERLLTIQQWRETYGPGSNVVLPAEEAEELACIALERMDAKAVAWTDTDELRDVKNGGNGYLFAIGGEANKFADPRRQVMLYTTPPVQMLEIENLEHFISFWKKVQAGQMKPGKNDIDHTVWFLEGLSNLTAPPAPVVHDEATPENIAILASTFAPRGVTYQWDSDECNAAADSWNACRAAMLQGAEHVTTAYKLPPHIFRELVNRLRDTAVKYQGCQQLREQLSRTLQEVIQPVAPQQEVTEKPKK